MARPACIGCWRFVALAAAAWLLLPGSPEGDQYATSRTLLAVPKLSQLNISGDVSNLLTLAGDGSGETAFDAGYAESASDGVILEINTNAAWDLSAKLAGDWSAPGGYDKDENDLYIRITNTPTGTIQNGADSYINLSGSDKIILDHTSGVSGDAVDVQSRVYLDWTEDEPGAYSIVVTYTLEAHVP